ncbi:hypothetical protein GCM10027280_54020 [Micromonospora polyrhachis]|uniref:Uncharacterized protein n=1 Tax=Micromonospora polyrhachis TaxID=1282883 RepID=A0A7W7SX70_9ACTN|nr:hypothetical protein [Micromonospora polyrhachis]MBB4962638.1 hypothetical protein [Micromonospora polyrhachis]
MDDTRHPVSRRGLLVGTTVVSALTLSVPAGGPARANPSTGPSGELVTRDRIAAARTRRPGGGPAPLRYTPDFHERLTEWLRFWWANTPRRWVTPLEVVAETTADGRALLLTGISHLHRGRAEDGFDARRPDPAYWATLSSLHHHFPVVRPEPAAGRVRVEDGVSGFTNSAEQVDFAVHACRAVWGYSATTTDNWPEYGDRALRRAAQQVEVRTRAGWAAFTRATVRLGLGTESY